MLATSVPSVTGAVRRKIVKTWRESVTTKPIALQGRARFLNVERDLDSPSVWNDRDGSRLWLYQLHYFNGLAGAALTDPDAASAFVGRWIRENPPAKGSGWEPFPVSLRIGNWIKFALQGGELNQTALDSLATQVEWLRGRLEYHLLGNHLLFNACALYSAGCFFDGDDAERWRAEGAKLIEEQVREQILADGMHFELSAMYQLLVLESLLDILNLSSAFDLPAPELRTPAPARVSARDELDDSLMPEDELEPRPIPMRSPRNAVIGLAAMALMVAAGVWAIRAARPELSAAPAVPANRCAARWRTPRPLAAPADRPAAPETKHPALRNVAARAGRPRAGG